MHLTLHSVQSGKQGNSKKDTVIRQVTQDNTENRENKDKHRKRPIVSMCILRMIIFIIRISCLNESLLYQYA